MAFCKSRANREVHNAKNLTQETRETSNKKPNLKAKAIKKRSKEEPQSQQKEGYHKIRPEKNKKEMKETIAKINNTKN